MAENPDNFEELDIAPERAQEIREQLTRVKESQWIESLRLLVQELGKDVVAVDEEGQSALNLPGIVDKSGPSRFFEVQSGAASGLRVILNQNEMRVYLGADLALEIAFLPKDGEYLVYSLNQELYEGLCAAVGTLEGEVKSAKQAKNQRQSAFREKFNKKSANEAPSP